VAAALGLALLAAKGAGQLWVGRPWALGTPASIALTGAVATSHAAGRLDDRPVLMVLTAIHQLGAAAWIGGMPYFIYAMARTSDGEAWRQVGRPFSLISMAAVASIAFAGLAMGWIYIGEWDAIYGTAYGVMTATKAILFLGLLAFGWANFRLVER